jgi:hypothetical protein
VQRQQRKRKLERKTAAAAAAAAATTPSGPIAVFCFQDFDDMVAKMREMRDEVRTPGAAPKTISCKL